MSKKIYVRKWPCAECGGEVRLFNVRRLDCKCGSIIYENFNLDVLKDSFDEVKEYDL